MPKRKPQQPHRNVIHLRLDLPLAQRLQQEADRRRIPVVREIRNRLLDSFEQDIQRGYLALLLDMQACWGRFTARYVSRELADQIADAVMAGADAGQLENLARQIIERRAIEQRQSNWRAS